MFGDFRRRYYEQLKSFDKLCNFCTTFCALFVSWEAFLLALGSALVWAFRGFRL